MAGLFSRLFRKGKKSVPQQMKRIASGAYNRLRARFDNAQTNRDNSNHWIAADGLSADAAANPGIRRILRNRSRYERDNNSYYDGMVDTESDDIIGTGPRLNMNVDGDDAAVVEKEFHKWMDACDFVEKLHTLRQAKTVDGEGLGMFVNNPKLETPVKFDLRLLEAEQCASLGTLPDENAVDGIRFDRAGNPVEYDIYFNHPGGTPNMGSFHPEPVPAERIIHLFDATRPGQRRGIPAFTSALGLFAMLRRWTLSVLAAAETAADFAAIMFSQKNPEEAADDADPFDEVEIARRSLMTLPKGWDMKQFKAEQPVSTYKEFKKELIGESARCISMPINIALGDSSQHNYASGRLDYQIYYKKIKNDRKHLTRDVLDRCFKRWAKEAVLIEGYLPQSFRKLDSDWSHTWYWDGNEHVDPAKEANGQAIRLQSNTTTLAEEYSRQGKDWKTEIQQRAKELAFMRELGMNPEDAAPKPQPVLDDEDDELPEHEAQLIKRETENV